MFVSKTSSRHLQRNNFSSSKTFWRHLARRLDDILKTFSRCLCKTSSRSLGRRKIVTLKTCSRRLQDISWRRFQDVFNTNKCFLGINGLEDCICNMESKHGIPNAFWLEWKNKMMELVNAGISLLPLLKFHSR